MFGALVFLFAGLVMVFGNRPLARKIAAVNRALGDRMPNGIRRWFFWGSYQSWSVPFARFGLVFMGLLWAAMGLVLVVLIALGVRVYD